jgi:hypothetical protein
MQPTCSAGSISWAAETTLAAATNSLWAAWYMALRGFSNSEGLKPEFTQP